MGRIFSAISRNLLVRAGAAALAVLVLLGVVTGTLPIACFARGAISCSTAPAVAHADAPVSAPLTSRTVVTVPITLTGEPILAEAAVASSEMPTEPPAPTLTQNELVAATFALFPPELTQMPVTAKPASTTSTAAASPSVRVVKTTPIRFQPWQVAETPAAVAAASVAASSEPAQPDDSVPLPIAYANELSPVAARPAVSSSAEASSEAVADVTPSAPTPKPVTKGDGQQMTVVGQGANVRSSPSKGKSSVLFALAGGSTVTVGEDMRGWIKITDDRGRSGWVYKDYLR